MVGQALGKLAAKLRQRDRLPALDLGEARLQGGEGVGVGQDLGGLLQRLILVDRHQSRRWGPVAGDQHVVAAIAYIIEQSAEVTAQLAHRDGLGHAVSVHHRVHISVAKWPRQGQERVSAWCR